MVRMDWQISDALVYSLSLGTVIDSGLKIPQQVVTFWLYMDGCDIVGRVAAVGNIPSPTGDESIPYFDYRCRRCDFDTETSNGSSDRWFISSSTHDDALSMLANRVVLNVTVTDKDGDTATDSKNIGDKFIFKDDGPTIGTGSALSATIVDESALVGARTPTDPDGEGPLPPYGTSATIDVSSAFNPNYGTDGAGNVVKTLVVNGFSTDWLSGIPLTGDAVVLYPN